MLFVVLLCITALMVLLFAVRGCMQKLAARYRAEPPDEAVQKKT
ncbi:MAG: hypothetical protein ACOX6U_06610 [Oscillospiraceae bacterium]